MRIAIALVLLLAGCANSSRLYTPDELRLRPFFEGFPHAVAVTECVRLDDAYKDGSTRTRPAVMTWSL